MSNKILIAAFFAMGMATWLFSGELTSNVVSADDSLKLAEVTKVPHVRAVISKADIRSLYLEVSGQTKANRKVQLKAEVSGRVEQIAAIKGSRVNAGDLLCKIVVDTRQSDVDQAQAELNSALLEYDGILDLKRRGLQSDINVARAKAALESSRASARRAELALTKTNIRAPFAGVIESQSVYAGDFLNVGQNCVTLIEIDPVLVVGQVAEKNINSIEMGGIVEVELIMGGTLSGWVSFIGRSPDSTTRTYTVEATVGHPGADIRVGLSAKMKIPLGEESAHLISAASLVLNDEGVVGVRIVDRDNIVRFKAVNILSEQSEGVWVDGLPKQVNLITVGHEEVFEGQTVKFDLSPLGTLVSS